MGRLTLCKNPPFPCFSYERSNIKQETSSSCRGSGNGYKFAHTSYRSFFVKFATYNLVYAAVEKVCDEVTRVRDKGYRCSSWCYISTCHGRGIELRDASGM